MQERQERTFLNLAGAVFILVFTTSMLQAQNATVTNPSESVGPTASELISGRSTSLSGMLSFDTSIGMNFTPHFGGDIGVPYFLVTRPGLFASTTGRNGYVSYPYVGCSFYFGCYYGVATSSRMWTGELGNFYADLHYARTYKQYNLLTVLTGASPSASFRKGMTTGRVQWDWFNHVDTSFHGFTPFANFGLANGRMDQHFLPRPFNTGLPFQTLGYMADFEGGVEYKVWRRFKVGFSLWDVLPMGPQKVFSELVWQEPSGSLINIVSSGGVTATGPNGGVGIAGGTGTATSSMVPGSIGYVAGDPNHGRYWNSAFETFGPSFIARDNGYSATLGFSPSKYADVQIGYNHSVRYAMDAVTFTVQLNANSLVRKLTNY